MAQVEAIIRAANRAGTEFAEFGQEKTDQILTAAYRAALDARWKLAELACEETGLGVVRDKVLKNVIAAQLVYESIKNAKTAGVIAAHPADGIKEIARPLGPIAATVPVTNPTSTAIFKALICLKTRNPLIISPHNAAKRCIAAAAEICYQAARAAGAPEHCIQWLEKASPKSTAELLGDPQIALVLATGPSSLVQSAYRYGRPVLGVGSGNVPVCIAESADVTKAVALVSESKTFDYGAVCASEQALITTRPIDGQVRFELEKHGGYFLNEAECARVGAVAMDPNTGKMTAAVVGQSALKIAATAKLDVPPLTRMLIAPLSGVGSAYPLSGEILAPILSYYVEPDFESAVGRACEILYYGGMGHTAVLHSKRDDEIERFSQRVPAGRVLINTPATHGALGGVFNRLVPSFSLACGSGGNNYLTDNISSRHLLNITRVAEARPDERFLRLAKNQYLDENIPAKSLEDLYSNEVKQRLR